MCCLFGMIDRDGRFSGKQKTLILHALATASEERGTDATGIAYNAGGKLHVYKRPIPGHRIHFRIPEDTRVVMGHTRMATQGSARQNRNNHPFKARAGAVSFALAHNGVLYNDDYLRDAWNLPGTNIGTDSYVAVQLLEQRNRLDFDSLRYMAEQVEGTFSFTVLDGLDNLYFVKGDNPLCIYEYPQGVYLYASTQAILCRALAWIAPKTGSLGAPQQVAVGCGEILRIDAGGVQTRSNFEPCGLFSCLCDPYTFPPALDADAGSEYRALLKGIASFYGYSPSYVEALLEDGCTTDDVEDLIYCGRF